MNALLETLGCRVIRDAIARDDDEPPHKYSQISLFENSKTFDEQRQPIQPSPQQPQHEARPRYQPAEEQRALTPVSPELRSLISFSSVYVHKIYFSVSSIHSVLRNSFLAYPQGPLVRKVERNPDGNKSKEDTWSDVWGQLEGGTLSFWDMEEIMLALKEGREVPPSYININNAVNINDAVSPCSIRAFSALIHSPTVCLPRRHHHSRQR